MLCGALSCKRIYLSSALSGVCTQDYTCVYGGVFMRLRNLCKFFCFVLLSTIFYFIFSHTTQHNIQNTTKQNNRHILNISRSNQKGGGEGRTTRTQKLLLYIITYIQQKTLPSINGRRPGPTNSRRCTFT